MVLTPELIVAQLLPMKFGPVENQPEGAPRQPSLNEFQRLDTDLCLMLAVYRVEVRRRMIVIKHSDDDSEEDAQCWHERCRSGSTLRNRQQRKTPVTKVKNKHSDSISLIINTLPA